MEQLSNLGKSILLIMNVPPPYQGTTIMNKYLLESLEEEQIRYTHLRVESAHELSDIGKFGIRKFSSAVSILRSILSKRKTYDVAYLVMSVDGFAFYRHATFVMLLQALGKKCLLHLHGRGFEHKKGISKLITKRIFNRSHLIQHSPYNKFDIDQYSSKKVHYVPNSLVDEFPRFEAASTAYRSKHASAVNVIFLSNLFRDKGAFITLESIRLVTEKYPDTEIRWYFVGKWHDEATKESFQEYISKHNLGKYISHIGPLYNDDKYNLLTQMDIMVFPTYYKHETWGNVLLEGMMFKIPVIASNYVAIPEMVKDNVNGYLIPKPEAAVLAEKTLLLANDPAKRKSMGEAGRKLFLDNFTQDKFKNKMINILSELNR